MSQIPNRTGSGVKKPRKGQVALGLLLTLLGLPSRLNTLTSTPEWLARLQLGPFWSGVAITAGILIVGHICWETRGEWTPLVKARLRPVATFYDENLTPLGQYLALCIGLCLLLPPALLVLATFSKLLLMLWNAVFSLPLISDFIAAWTEWLDLE